MIARMVIAMARLVDMPQIMKQIMVLVRPINITGLRPILSDNLPQGTAVKLWESENMDPVMPAHFATWFFSTPKLWIISGR